MWKLLGWIHAKLYLGVLWLLLLPFRAMWAFARVVMLWLGEEFQRWAGILASGAMVFLAGKVVLQFAPTGLRKPLALAVLVLAAIWSVAAMRAARYTLHNSLRLVRQRQAFRELAGDVGTIRQRVSDSLARATEGTRAGRMFQKNRDADDLATSQAERERRAAEAEERRRDELVDLEVDPYETQAYR